MDRKNALMAFDALSQGTRLDVFRLLIQAGPQGLSVTELCQALEVRQNTMSVNLAILLTSGLVRNERQGRSIRYFADMAGVKSWLHYLLEDCCGGQVAQCQPLIDTLDCGC